MVRHGIVAAVVAVAAGVSLLLGACGGGGGGGSPPSSNSGGPLTVTANASVASTTTLGPAYVVDTLTAQAANGTPPYTYSWSAQGSTHSTLSSTTIAAPSLAATLNWGDAFTDSWQVTVTDAASHTATATVSVSVSITAPVADGMPAGFAATPIRGSIVSDSVATAVVPGAGSYSLAIYLPADYAATSDSLPVIYATDGVADLSDPTQYNGWQTPDMARILEAKGLRAIIVGIGGYERRGTDYLLPGATDFYGFVTAELIPYVEKHYRASASGRTLSGHSYGGLFVGLAMMMDRPGNRYFTNFLSQDGSYYDQPSLTASMEQSLSAASGGNLPDTVLVLSSSTAGNDAYVDTFFQQLQAMNVKGWQLTRIPNYDTGHLQMFDKGFAASLDVAFDLPSGL